MARTANDAPLAIRPELIVLAREARGLTQSRVASLLGVSQGHLSKVEAGLLPVSDHLVDGLSSVLDFPPHFFAQPEPVYGPGTSEFFHRKRKTLSPRLLATLHAQVNIRRIQIARLLQGVEVEGEQIPEYDPDAFDSIEEIARAVRAAWNLPKGPVENVTESIEAAGGIVVLADFGTPKLDAVGRYIPGLPPLFFINRDSPGDRTRLTLAHELGHTVMHQVPNPEMEEQATRFAAEFLMPERDIRHELEYLSIDRLVALKIRWQVSMQALLVRAERLGKITPRQARYLWMQIGKAGFRTREPAEADVPREQPRLLAEIVETYVTRMGFTPDEVADLLAINAGELEANYGVQSTGTASRPRLHLVGSRVASV
jgi:Zn-dependent peptidase ImmA (M78 family)/transcriptional regulator with XRE-family HTH domain